MAVNIFDENAGIEPKPYRFISGDISAFMNEFQRPKQEMNIEENFENFPEEQEPAGAEPPRMTASMANSTAKIAVTSIDSILPEIMRALAKSETADDFKADSDSKKELEKAFAEYIKIKGIGDIPPGLMVVILVIVIYGSKIPLVLQLRKANEQAERQKAEIERLEAEIRAFKEKEDKEDTNEKRVSETP